LKVESADSSASLHVLQLSDLHVLADSGGRLLGVDTLQTLEAALRAGAGSGPVDAVVISGDIVHEPTRDAYARAADMVRAHLLAPTLWLPGNHDQADAMASHLPVERELVLGDWLVLGIDTHVDGREGGHVSAAELARIEAVLERSDARHVLAFGHHPCVAVGTPWLDGGRIDNAEAFLGRLAADPRVRGYAFGHIHHAQAYDGAPWPLWSAPSTCFAFAQGGSAFSVASGPPGCRRFSLGSDGRVDSRVVTADDCVVQADMRQFR